jgi:hypothetical protein
VQPGGYDDDLFYQKLLDVGFQSRIVFLPGHQFSMLTAWCPVTVMSQHSGRRGGRREIARPEGKFHEVSDLILVSTFATSEHDSSNPVA